MKKNLSFLILGLIIFGGISLQSCEKCMTCSYTYTVGGQSQTYTYPEVCGNRSDVNDLEDLCAQQAALAGAGNCNCD